MSRQGDVNARIASLIRQHAYESGTLEAFDKRNESFGITTKAEINTSPSGTASSGSTGADAITQAMEQRAASLAARAQELNRLQEDLNQRYAALQSGQSTESAQQLAIEQDRLNDRKVNYERDSAQYGVDSAYYDTILSAAPYIAVERQAEKSGTQVSGGVQALIDTMQQRVNQIDKRRKEVQEEQAALEERARLLQYNTALTQEEREAEQLAINQAVANLTTRQQNLMRDAGVYSEEARSYDDTLIEQAERDMMDFATRQMDAYYDEAAMAEAYEGQKNALYAEWQELNQRELQTGIYGERTASDVWDEYMALDDEYARQKVEADEYWTAKQLQSLSKKDLQNLETIVQSEFGETAFTRNQPGRGKNEQASKAYQELYEKYSYQEVESYLQIVRRQENAKTGAIMQETVQKLTKEKPVAANVAIALSKIPATIGAAAEFAGQIVNNPAGYRTLDIYGAGNVLQNAGRTVQQTTVDEIKASLSPFWGNVASGAYQLGMSTVDSLMAMGTGTSLMLATNAATNTMQDITERGGTIGQAVVGGILAGAAEAVFEKVSIENFQALSQTEVVRTVSDWVGNVAKSMATNASEEMATEFANIVADSIVMGEFSTYAEAVREMMAQNPEMSEDEAKIRVAGQMGLQILESGASGAIMGGFFGLLGSGIAQRRTTLRDGMVSGAIAQGLGYEGSEAFQIAAGLQVQLNEGFEVSDEDLGRLIAANQVQTDERTAAGANAEQTAAAASTEAILALPEAMGEIAEAMPEVQTKTVQEAETAPVQGASAQEEVRQEVAAPVVQETVREESSTENIPARGVSENAAEGVTEENVLRREAEQELRGLAEEYKGEEFRQAAQNLANDMRMAGNTAYAEAIEAVAAEMILEPAAVSANNVRTAPASAVQTEGVQYGGEESGVRLRDGGERNDGQSPGGQTGAVAEAAGRAPAADERRQLSAKQSLSKRVAERISRGGGQSTRAATGLTNAMSSGAPVYVLEEQDMSPEEYETLNDAAANGYRVKLMVGKMTFRGANGRQVKVDGARAGDDLFVSVNGDFSGRQIANHEMFHAIAEDNPGLIDAIMEEVLSGYDEAELEKLMKAYADLYDGAYDEAEMLTKIAEEICADAYAGMDRANFGKAQAVYAKLTDVTGAVRELTERRTGLRAIGERGVRETRAGPTDMKNAPAEAEAYAFSLVSIGGKYYTPTDAELIETHDTIEVVRVNDAKYTPGVELSDSEYKRYRDQQSEKMRKIFGVYTNKDTAYSDTYGTINAEIGAKTLRKARSNGGVALFDVLPKMNEIFENAVVMGTKADRNNDTNIKGIVDMLGCADIGNERIAIIKLNVKEYVDDTAKVYGNRVVEIEKLTVLAGVGHSTSDASTSYAVSFEPILQRYKDAVKKNPVNTATEFSLASGQSAEQVEERISELEGLMENLMTEQKTMDPAEFNVRWFNLQMEKAALESELYDEEQKAERQRLREEAKAKRERDAVALEKIEKYRTDAKKYKELADKAEMEYEKTEDAKFLESAKKYRDLQKEFQKKANDLRREIRGKVDVKNATRVYKPTEAIKRTENRILNLFKIQAGNRGEARQALTGVLLDTLERGYVGQEALEAVLRQMYQVGIDVVPAEELYQDIADTLKGSKIYVSDELKNEYGDDWKNVRGKLLGLGIYTTSDRAELGVDSVYAELAGQYPGVFDEENVDMRGMLDEMLEAASMGRTTHMTLADSAAVRGLSSEEDFWNLYRLAGEELARFADAAGVESRVRSQKEWQIAMEQAEHSAKEKKILKASRERADEIRRQELGKRQAMVARRQRTEQMDRMRRQIQRLNRMVEKNSDLWNKMYANMDAQMKAAMNMVMETIDLISNGFRASAKKDLLALQEGMALAKREDPYFEKNSLEIIKNELLKKKEYRDMEAGAFDAKAKARLEQALAAMDRLGKVRLTDMSVEDLNAIYEAVSAIIHEIDHMSELLGEAWDMNVDEGANQIREEVGKARGVRDNLRGKTISGARHLMAEQSLSPSRMLARLVGYDRSGAMGKVIREFEQGDLAAMKYALDADILTKAFLSEKKNRDWLKTAGGKHAKMVTLEIPRVLEYGEGDAPIYDPNAVDKIQVSQMMLVQMMLDLENEANTRHAEKGGYTIPNAREYRRGNHKAMYENAKTVMIPREALRKIVNDHLTEEGKAFARVLHRYYNGTSKQAINEVSQKLNGVDVARVRNYYPIHTDQAYRGKEYNVFDATLESMGSLKERQYSESPILLEDAGETFRWHRDSMARYVGYAVARRNFVALLNHRNAGGKTLRAEIEDKWSYTAGESIDEFFRILETGQLEEVRDILTGLQSKYAGAVLSYNVGSMMKQLGALPMAGSTVGHGAILHGMLHPTKMGAKQRELIRKYTPYLDYRGKGYTYRELAETAGKGIQDDRLDRTFNYLMGRNWLEAMDIKVNTALWHAAEYAVKRDTRLKPGSQADIEAGIDPYYKAVAEVFNRMTHDTQTNYNMMARPPVLMRKGLMLRAFTMFRTDAYQVTGALRENYGAWQQARRNYRNAGTDEEKTAAREQIHKTAKGVARTTAAVVGNAMISVIVDEMRQLIRGNDEEYFDEEGKLVWETVAAKLGKGVLMNIAGCFMFVEELAEFIEAKITKDRYYEPEVGRVGMLVDAAESLWKMGATIAEVFQQATAIRKDGGDVVAYLDHEWDNVFGVIRNAAVDGAYLVGSPLKNFERTVTTALGWILPEAKIAYNDMFTDYSKALLRDMGERELPYGIDAYLRDNCSITDDQVRDEYLRLYQAVGDEMMPGAEPPDKIKVGEGDEAVAQETTLSDRGRWDSKYREVMIDETKALIESEAYKRLTDEEKAEALALIDKYAEQVARQTIGVEADAWVRHTMAARVDPGDVVAYKAATGGMKAAESYAWIAESGMQEAEAVAVLGVVMQNADGPTAGYGHMQEALKNGLGLSEWAELYAIDDSKVESFNKWVADGLDKDIAMQIAVLTDELEPEEGKSQVSDMQKYRVLAEGLEAENAWAAIRTLTNSDNGRETLDAVKKTGITPSQYLDIREDDQLSNYLDAVGLGIKTFDAVNIVKKVADIPKHADGSDITQKERQLAAVRASDSVEVQILAYALYGEKDNEQSSIEKLTKAWEECKLTPEDYTLYRIDTGNLNAKDENGNTVTNLKKARMVMAIDQMNLTKEQKDYLYDMNYKKDRNKALWNINRSFSSAEEYANWL